MATSRVRVRVLVASPPYHTRPWPCLWSARYTRGAAHPPAHRVRTRAMCVYEFHVQHLRPLVALVGAHGATDLATGHWPPIYAACCLAPLPPKAVTALFVAASLVHFAEDGGPDGSLAIHSLAGFAWLWLGAQRALELMLAYLALVHTPAHYARCWRRRRRGALALAAVATAVAGVATRRMGAVCVSHAVQRLVVAHVVCEWYVECA